MGSKGDLYGIGVVPRTETELADPGSRTSQQFQDPKDCSPYRRRALAYQIAKWHLTNLWNFEVQLPPNQPTTKHLSSEASVAIVD